MIGIVYAHGTDKGVLPVPSDTAIKVSTSAGTVIGQFGFGALADIVGRKRMYGLELIVIIVATLAQALSGPGPGTDIIGLLIFWRVIMGIGEFILPSVQVCVANSNILRRNWWRLPSVFYYHIRVSALSFC